MPLLPPRWSDSEPNQCTLCARRSWHIRVGVRQKDAALAAWVEIELAPFAQLPYEFPFLFIDRLIANSTRRKDLERLRSRRLKHMSHPIPTQLALACMNFFDPWKTMCRSCCVKGFHSKGADMSLADIKCLLIVHKRLPRKLVKGVIRFYSLECTIIISTAD